MKGRTGTHEARVEHVARMMRALTFRRGKTAKALAKEWGMAEQSVRRITAEASRRVRDELSDGEREQAAVLSLLVLEDVVHDSLRAARDSKGTPEEARNRAVAINALKELRELTGAGAAQKVDVTVSDLPTDKLEAMLADAVKALRKSRT